MASISFLFLIRTISFHVNTFMCVYMLCDTSLIRYVRMYICTYVLYVWSYANTCMCVHTYVRTTLHSFLTPLHSFLTPRTTLHSFLTPHTTLHSFLTPHTTLHSFLTPIPHFTHSLHHVPHFTHSLHHVPHFTHSLHHFTHSLHHVPHFTHSLHHVPHFTHSLHHFSQYMYVLLEAMEIGGGHRVNGGIYMYYPHTSCAVSCHLFFIVTVQKPLAHDSLELSEEELHGVLL